MINVSSGVFTDAALCDKIFKIRNEVFVVEQKVTRDEEFDDYEQSSVHYLGSLDGIPAGTARWRITDNGIKLERFAVLLSNRNLGVAAAILVKVLNDVSAAKVKIYLHSQESAIGFYEKYGFVKDGDMFMEANIRHFKMYFKQ